MIKIDNRKMTLQQLLHVFCPDMVNSAQTALFHQNTIHAYLCTICSGIYLFFPLMKHPFVNDVEEDYIIHNFYINKIYIQYQK